MPSVTGPQRPGGGNPDFSGPPILGQPPGFAATGVGGRLLTSGSMSTTSSVTITPSISPLTGVVFVHIAQRQNPNAPVVLTMESPLGGPWLQQLTRGSGLDRKSELWMGIGVSGSGPISIISSLPAVGGFYAVFEFTGIDQGRPTVGNNVISATGTNAFSTYPNLLPNTLESGHNAFFAAVSQNNPSGLAMVPPGTEVLYNSNSSDGFILGVFTGWTADGPVGATWTNSTNFRVLGAEVVYNPASVPLTPVFPRRVETFPKVPIVEAFNTVGPPILAEQIDSIRIPVLEEAGFRGRNDDGNETTATWKAAENVNWSQDVDTNFRLRFVADEIADNDLQSTIFQLMYSLNGGPWLPVQSASTVVHAIASPNVVNNTPTTRQLTGGSGAFTPGVIDTNDGRTNNIDLGQGGITEVEHSLVIVGTDVTNGDTIQFRQVISPPGTFNADTIVLFDRYTQIPTVTVVQVVPETIEVLIAADPIPTLQDPIPGPDAFIWQHEQDQGEWLSPFVFNEAIEVLIAADPIPSTQDPSLNPPADFFVWDHKQDQGEWMLGRLHLENNAEGGTAGLYASDGPPEDGGNTGGASGDYFDEIRGDPDIDWPGHVRFDTDRRIDNFSYRMTKNSGDSVSPSLAWTGPGWGSFGGSSSLIVNQQELYARFYVWIGTYPSGAGGRDLNLFQFWMVDTFGIVKAGITGAESVFGPGMLYFGDPGGAALGGGPVPLERWVRFEFHVKTSNPTAKEVRVWYTDPNSAGAADLVLGPDPINTPNPILAAIMGNTDFYIGSCDIFMDNIGVDTLTWLGPLGTAPAELAVSPNTITAAQRSPMDVLHPPEAQPYELWDHRQDQAEWLFEVLAPPILPEVLVAADMFSSGNYPSRPLEAADIFLTYDQNPDPAPIIPPDLSGNIRRVPRWAKQKNFYAGGH